MLGYVYTFPTCCLPASFFFEKLQALYIEMAPKRTPQALQQPSTFLPFCIISPYNHQKTTRILTQIGNPLNFHLVSPKDFRKSLKNRKATHVILKRFRITSSQAQNARPKGTPLDPKDHRKVLLSSLPPFSSLSLPCSCLPSSSLLPPFSRPSATFCQPLLANQSVHQPWGSLQGAGGTGRQPLIYPPPQRSFCKSLDVKVRQLTP